MISRQLILKQLKKERCYYVSTRAYKGGYAFDVQSNLHLDSPPQYHARYREIADEIGERVYNVVKWLKNEHGVHARVSSAVRQKEYTRPAGVNHHQTRMETYQFYSLIVGDRDVYSAVPPNKQEQVDWMAAFDHADEQGLLELPLPDRTGRKNNRLANHELLAYLKLTNATVKEFFDSKLPHVKVRFSPMGGRKNEPAVRSVYRKEPVLAVFRFLYKLDEDFANYVRCLGEVDPKYWRVVDE